MDGDELKNPNDQKNKEVRNQESVPQEEHEKLKAKLLAQEEEIESLKALLNLQRQSESTQKKQKSSQNQENKKASLKENVPVAGSFTSKTVRTSDNSQELYRINKHQNKKPPNIKATESTPSKISKKSDTKENKKGSLKENVPVAGSSTSKTVTTSDNSQESCRTNKLLQHQKKKPPNIKGTHPTPSRIYKKCDSKENKKGSLKKNVPVAGSSTSKTVTTSNNSQELYRINKHQNKKPPNIKAAESSPPEICKKSDTKVSSIRDELKDLNDQKSKEVRNEESESGIERIKAQLNLQSEDIQMRQKSPQNQQDEKISENEKRSVELQVAGPSTSSTVAASDNAQEPCCTNEENKSKKPPKNFKTVQFTPSQIPKDSDTNNSQSTKHKNQKPPNIKATESTPPEIPNKKSDTKAEINKETYKKKGGTSAHGHEYEYSMCAYLALELSKDNNVINFTMTSNNAALGIFDDIELIVTFSDESSHTFYIQLKHSEKKGNITKEMFDKADKKEGDFYLKKYFESREIKQNRKDMTCVLFTNRSLHLRSSSLTLKGISGEVTVKPYEAKSSNHLLINTAEKSEETCFQFELHHNQDNPKNTFFPKFCLFTNQIGVKECQSRIEEKLNNLFGCKIDFVGFMHHWWKNNFVLTRHVVITKLAELALWSYIQEIPIKSENSPAEKSEALKSAIDKFNMTLITECDNDKVKKMWAGSSDEIKTADMSKAALKYGLLTTGISNKDKMSALDQSKVLWYLNKVPLIVKYEEEAKDKVLAAVKLLGTEEEKMKLILLGNHSRGEFNTAWKVFENLYDLQDEESYKKIIETFKVSLQGRTSISLEQLIQVNQEIAKDIKTKELFQMLEEELCIGKPQAVLPQVYIPRTITTSPLNTNITQFKEMEYIPSPKKKIREDELFSIFKNSLNVVTGKPGIGKSTLLTFLSQNCPSDSWCVRINLIEFNSVFKEKLDHEAVLNKILKNSVKQVSDTIYLDKFKSSKKIYLLLDGLDEMDSECIKQVLEFIKFISAMGVKVWVSSRENLRERLEREMEVVPIEVQELTEEDQRKYISKRLLSNPSLNKKYSEDEVENTITKIFESVSINYNAKRLLGIPLQLYIITEIFRGQSAIEFTEDIFVLSKMYRTFFYGKYDHQQAKAKTKYEAQLDNKHYFDYILKSFELPAVRACLDEKTFNKLELEERELEKSRKFLEGIKRDGNKLGIISQVVNEGQKLQAIFYHQTFAEYFACRWLEENVAKHRLIKNEFFKNKYQNLRLIFDIMLAEDKPLHLATIYKSPDQVEKYIEQSNDKDKGGRSALHVICSYCEVAFSWYGRDEDETLHVMEILKLLLQNYNYSEKDNLFDWDWQGYALHCKTLLPFNIFLKIRKEKKIIINENLFEHFSYDELVNYCSRFGYSHLLTAIVMERENITNKMGVELICQAVEKCVESKQEYFKNQYIETIKVLANAGCNINEKDSVGYTPLHYAWQYNSLDVIEILLNNGADINAVTDENESVLHLASEENEPEIIEFLINKGAQVNQVAENNWTPLHYACQFNSLDVIEILLNNRADINAVTDENKNVLHLVSDQNKPEIIEFLINKGAQVNQVAENNWTPLHYACQYNSLDVIGILLNNGADINAVTNKNQTVLHFASRQTNAKIIKFLINKGAQVNQVNVDNWTPLHYACRYNTRDVIEILVNNGADINAVTNQNQTVLDLAKKNKKIDPDSYSQLQLIIMNM